MHFGLGEEHFGRTVTHFVNIFMFCVFFDDFSTVHPSSAIVVFSRGGCRPPGPPAKRPSARPKKAPKIDQKIDQTIDQKSTKKSSKNPTKNWKQKIPKGAGAKRPPPWGAAEGGTFSLLNFCCLIFCRAEGFLRGGSGGAAPPGKTQNHKSLYIFQKAKKLKT